MAKQEMRVLAVLDQPGIVKDIGDFDVQLWMGNFVLVDRRGGLPHGYGTYSYLPYNSLTGQWQVVPDVRGTATSLVARREGTQVVVAELVDSPSGVDHSASASDSSAAPSSSGAAAALGIAAVGFAAAGVSSWLKGRKRTSSEKKNSPQSTTGSAAPESSAPAAKSLSAEQLYEKARAHQASAEHSAAIAAFRDAVTTGDGASVGVAASLFQLGLHEIEQGDVVEARILLGRSAECFEAVATKARSEGRPDVAKAAAAEAARAKSLSLTAATGKPWPAPGGGSQVRDQQLAQMARLDEERMRINQSWAQGLGRI